MDKKQHIFQYLTIEVVTVLLASIISFPLSNAMNIQLSTLPLVVVACYVVLKFIYYLCISISELIKEFGFIHYPHSMQSKQEIGEEPIFKNTSPVTEDEDFLTKHMKLFHDEYQYEEKQYHLQKEREADEKLCAVLRYTRKTFEWLDFEEDEVFQICECVRYFVTNQQVRSITGIHIRKRATVTQISLKNFAWNIAFQYNINGDITAQFVMHTFNEWFSNSTIDTIRKNLRTTTGRHKIEIDENIISSNLS